MRMFRTAWHIICRSISNEYCRSLINTRARWKAVCWNNSKDTKEGKERRKVLIIDFIVSGDGKFF